MLGLSIHEDAIADLKALRQNGHAAIADRILVLLDEVNGDQSLARELLTHEFGADGDERISVKKWQEHWRRGANLWSLKFWDLEHLGIRYRIIYAYVPDELWCYVLAVAPRVFDYKRDHPLTKRILETYETL